MIDRCICFDKTFGDMKKIIDEHGFSSINELNSIIPFDENCGICRPYVQLVIQTGKTSFDTIKFDPGNL